MPLPNSGTRRASMCRMVHLKVWLCTRLHQKPAGCTGSVTRNREHNPSKSVEAQCPWRPTTSVSLWGSLECALEPSPLETGSSSAFQNQAMSWVEVMIRAWSALWHVHGHPACSPRHHQQACATVPGASPVEDKRLWVSRVSVFGRPRAACYRRGLHTGVLMITGNWGQSDTGCFVQPSDPRLCREDI